MGINEVDDVQNTIEEGDKINFGEFWNWKEQWEMRSLAGDIQGAENQLEERNFDSTWNTNLQSFGGKDSFPLFFWAKNNTEMFKEMCDVERKILESGASSHGFSFPHKNLLVMWLWVSHRTQIWSLWRTAAGKSVCNILSEICQIRGRRAFWSEEGRAHHWICRTWVKCQKMNRILADTIMKREYMT